MTGDIADARRLLAAGANLGVRLFTFPIPVVLGVTGHALAMGGILTTTADYRVGADGPYKIGLNEVAIGMPVPSFAVELCRDRLSPRGSSAACRARRSARRPRRSRPASSTRSSLLTDVPDRALAVAAQLAETVHPGPFRMTRTTIRGALAEQLRTGLEADMALFDVTT